MAGRIWIAIGVSITLGGGTPAGPVWAQGSFLGGLTGKAAPAPQAPSPEVPDPVSPPTEESTAPDGGTSSLRPGRPPTPAAPTSPAPAEAAPEGAAHGFAGIWSGTYTCAQGLTGVTFAFDPPSGGEISAVVSFFPVEANPGVPAGRFRVTGPAPAPGDRAMVFYPDGWIEKPPGYVMVGFELRLSADDMALRAKLSGAPGCTTALLGRGTGG